MKTVPASAALLALSTGLAALATPPSCGAGYGGRWNVKILDAGDTFPSAWFRFDAANGHMEGQMVWKWGGVTPLSNVRVRDGELGFRREDTVFLSRIVGEELLGYVTNPNGERLRFAGRRAPELCDVRGTWKVRLEGDREVAPGTVELDAKDAKITGRATDPGGLAYDVRNADLTRNVLTFDAVPRGSDEALARCRFEIRGDRLGGIVTPLSGEDNDPPVRVSGERLREWGTPVSLVARERTAGWRPRDPEKKFGWKVRGGVLENAAPGVDIVSERKFRDFRLHLEYRVADGSNSGVYLRGRYELQVVGNRARRPHGNMAIYSRLSPSGNPMRPLEEWQEIDVTLIGRWLTVRLNGQTVHDNQYLDGITGGALDPWEGEPGPLMLQGDHDRVEYRNIVVTPAK